MQQRKFVGSIKIDKFCTGVFFSETEKRKICKEKALWFTKIWQRETFLRNKTNHHEQEYYIINPLLCLLYIDITKTIEIEI